MIYVRNKTRFNIYASGTIDGVRYANFTDPTVQKKLGITPVDEPLPPVDYDPKTWYKQELDQEPYVQYTKKDDKTIKFNRREELESFISQQEASTLLARPTREFMLTLFELEAVKAGLTPEQLTLVNPGYAKVKELDVAITAARNEVRSITAEIGDDRNLLPVDEKPTETSV
jgi:hypothetical protein